MCVNRVEIWRHDSCYVCFSRGKREFKLKVKQCPTGSPTTAAAGRGRRLFTIPSKTGEGIMHVKSLCCRFCFNYSAVQKRPFRKRKTVRLSRALSDLVTYTKSVRVHDIETQGKHTSDLLKSVRSEILTWFFLLFLSFYKQLAGLVPERDGDEPDSAAQAG